MGPAAPQLTVNMLEEALLCFEKSVCGVIFYVNGCDILDMSILLLLITDGFICVDVYIGLGTGGATGAMTPSLFSKHYS